MTNNIEDNLLLFEETARYYQSLQVTNDQETLVQFLKETQEIFGCIPADAKTRISEIMKMSTIIIDKIISIYPSLTNEKFQTEIIVCSGASCSSKNAQKLLSEIQTLLQIRPGQVTKDGRYKLTTKPCMKQCKKGPNLMIGDAIYHNIDSEKLKTLLL
ncbi:NADH-quinone oxidoreductase subunit NuoE family protein [Faecalimonas sp.]